MQQPRHFGKREDSIEMLLTILGNIVPDRCRSTPPPMENDVIQEIFDLCVDLLNWLADLFGCTYEEINVLIFCVLGPIIFMSLVVDNIRLRWHRRKG